jgi:hypothetical protein
MVSRAKDTHMTNRVVRLDDEDWADYELACKDKGLTRSADIRMHVKREVAAFKRRKAAEPVPTAAERAFRDGKS